MDQAVIDGLQHFRLTKEEEEEEIYITAMCRSDLLEECSLSLFGPLLSDLSSKPTSLEEHTSIGLENGSSSVQNIKDCGLKGMARGILKTTCCSFADGKWDYLYQISPSLTLSFGSKFGVYHLKTCLKKLAGMWETISGTKLKRTRAHGSQNKLNLCGGGNVVNKGGGQFWVTFKNERVPNFCFLCGKLGHDERHCSESPDNHNQGRQYGDWLRANGNLKNGFGKSKASNSGGYEDRDGRPDDRSYLVTSNSGVGNGKKSMTPITGQSLNDTTPVRVHAAEMSAVQAAEI
ncbi:hypothetical protein SO802_013124 [Lithocarpus litseifolius]|uniref:CCHC-type domain-containing protein n=1 Tax=Lithocarpus litseifolius TaxID=425828 RepID=A0AAW2D7C7_9ROSI